MFQISENGQIRLVRGDSFKVPFNIIQGTSMTHVAYNLGDRDTLYFGVMEPNSNFENAIIRKKYTKKDLINGYSVYLELDPEDTEFLLPGKYYYQIKLEIYDAVNDKTYVDTIVPKTLFWLED